MQERKTIITNSEPKYKQEYERLEINFADQKKERKEAKREVEPQLQQDRVKPKISTNSR